MGGLGLHTGAGYGERGAVSGLGRCPPTAPKSEWADPAPTEAPPGHAVPDRTRGFPNLPPLCPPVPPRLPNLALDSQGQHELERKAFQEGRVQAKPRTPKTPTNPKWLQWGRGYGPSVTCLLLGGRERDRTLFYQIARTVMRPLHLRCTRGSRGSGQLCGVADSSRVGSTRPWTPLGPHWSPALGTEQFSFSAE